MHAVMFGEAMSQMKERNEIQIVWMEGEKFA